MIRRDQIFLPTDREHRTHVYPMELAVPRSIDVHGNMLVWSDERLTSREIKEPGFIDFIRLQDGTPEAILAFARRYGPLRLCAKHYLPDRHDKPMYRSERYQHDGCRPRPWPSDDDFYCEPLAEWQRYAQGAAALVRIMYQVNQQQPGKTRDWKIVTESPIRPAFFFQIPGPAVEKEKRRIIRFLDAWFDAAGIRLHLRRNDDNVLPTFDAGLFGVLAIQLGTLFTQHRWPICGYCFLPYITKRRRSGRGETPCCDNIQCVRDKNAKHQRTFNSRRPKGSKHRPSRA